MGRGKSKKPREYPRYIWMWVTEDELSLPLAIADTSDELARKVGVASGNTIVRYMLERKRRNITTPPKYVKVDYIK